MTTPKTHPCATDRIMRPSLMVEWTCPVCTAKWRYGQLDAFGQRFGWARMEPAHV